MTIKRLDHVSVVVDDLETAKAFFVELGLELEGEMTVEGPWVDRVTGLKSELQTDLGHQFSDLPSDLDEEQAQGASWICGIPSVIS